MEENKLPETTGEVMKKKIGTAGTGIKEKTGKPSFSGNVPEDGLTPEELAEAKKAAKEEAKRLKEEQKKKAKEGYPTKTTLNLYYREDKTTGPATIALYVLFGLVLLIAFIKFGIYDIQEECRALETQLEDQQMYSDAMMIALKDYNQVKAEYSRYTQNYLEEKEILQDRIRLFDMLEETVFAQSKFSSVSIIEDSILLSYTGLDLEETAALSALLLEYTCVKQVDVQSASLSVNDNSGIVEVQTSMIIDLVTVAEEEERIKALEAEKAAEEAAEGAKEADGAADDADAAGEGAEAEDGAVGTGEIVGAVENAVVAEAAVESPKTAKSMEAKEGTENV